MSKLYIMVGIPGSGKSYHAQQLQSELEGEGRWCRIVSSDTYRKIVCGDENDQTKNELVFKCLYNDMVNFIDKFNYDVILDATNTTLKTRRKVFEKIKSIKDKIEEVIAYVVAPPVRTCIEQDAKRARSVGESVIKKFLFSFQFPQKFEGFDHIWVNDYRETCLPEFNQSELNQILKVMYEFDQNNPHHLFTLGKHCEVAADQVRQRTPYWTPMLVAAGIHDVGKLFTYTEDDNGVAHYYNHDCAGTYFLASNLNLIACSNWDDIFEVLFYVNYHMRAHNDFCGPKAERKYKALFGEDRFARLMLFGECDRIASGTYKEDCNE